MGILIFYPTESDPRWKKLEVGQVITAIGEVPYDQWVKYMLEAGHPKTWHGFLPGTFKENELVSNSPTTSSSSSTPSKGKKQELKSKEKQ